MNILCENDYGRDTIRALRERIEREGVCDE